MKIYEKTEIGNSGVTLEDLVSGGMELQPATASKLGGIKVGENLAITEDGTLSAQAQVEVPLASSTNAGIIKVGNNLTISEDGTLSTHSAYSLPTASSNTLGGVKIGTNLSINNGVLSSTQRSDSSIVDLIYPVGSIYMSVNSTSPTQLFGGDWTRISEGKVLIGVDENNEWFNQVGEKGSNGNSGSWGHSHGSNYHVQANASGNTLRFYEFSGVSWTGNAYRYFSGNGDGSAWQGWGWGVGGSSSSTTVVPPKYCVYIWKRIG